MTNDPVMELHEHHKGGNIVGDVAKLKDTCRELKNAIAPLSLGSYVTLEDEQTITGNKTFTGFLKCTKVPEKDDDVVNVGALKALIEGKEFHFLHSKIAPDTTETVEGEEGSKLKIDVPFSINKDTVFTLRPKVQMPAGPVNVATEDEVLLLTKDTLQSVSSMSIDRLVTSQFEYTREGNAFKIENHKLWFNRTGVISYDKIGNAFTLTCLGYDTQTELKLENTPATEKLSISFSNGVTRVIDGDGDESDFVYRDVDQTVNGKKSFTKIPVFVNGSGSEFPFTHSGNTVTLTGDQEIEGTKVFKSLLKTRSGTKPLDTAFYPVATVKDLEDNVREATASSAISTILSGIGMVLPLIGGALVLGVGTYYAVKAFTAPGVVEQGSEFGLYPLMYKEGIEGYTKKDDAFMATSTMITGDKFNTRVKPEDTRLRDSYVYKLKIGNFHTPFADEPEARKNEKYRFPHLDVINTSAVITEDQNGLAYSDVYLGKVFLPENVMVKTAGQSNISAVRSIISLDKSMDNFNAFITDVPDYYIEATASGDEVLLNGYQPYFKGPEENNKRTWSDTLQSIFAVGLSALAATETGAGMIAIGGSAALTAFLAGQPYEYSQVFRNYVETVTFNKIGFRPVPAQLNANEATLTDGVRYIGSRYAIPVDHNEANPGFETIIGGFGLDKWHKDVGYGFVNRAADWMKWARPGILQTINPNVVPGMKHGINPYFLIEGFKSIVTQVNPNTWLSPDPGLIWDLIVGNFKDIYKGIEIIYASTGTLDRADREFRPQEWIQSPNLKIPTLFISRAKNEFGKFDNFALKSHHGVVKNGEGIATSHRYSLTNVGGLDVIRQWKDEEHLWDDDNLDILSGVCSVALPPLELGSGAQYISTTGIGVTEQILFDYAVNDGFRAPARDKDGFTYKRIYSIAKPDEVKVENYNQLFQNPDNDLLMGLFDNPNPNGNLVQHEMAEQFKDDLEHPHRYDEIKRDMRRSYNRILNQLDVRDIEKEVKMPSGHTFKIKTLLEHIPYAFQQYEAGDPEAVNDIERYYRETYSDNIRQYIEKNNTGREAYFLDRVKNLYNGTLPSWAPILYNQLQGSKINGPEFWYDVERFLIKIRDIDEVYGDAQNALGWMYDPLIKVKNAKGEISIKRAKGKAIPTSAYKEINDTLRKEKIDIGTLTNGIFVYDNKRNAIVLNKSRLKDLDKILGSDALKKLPTIDKLHNRSVNAITAVLKKKDGISDLDKRIEYYKKALNKIYSKYSRHRPTHFMLPPQPEPVEKKNLTSNDDDDEVLGYVPVEWQDPMLQTAGEAVMQNLADNGLGVLSGYSRYDPDLGISYKQINFINAGELERAGTFSYYSNPSGKDEKYDLQLLKSKNGEKPAFHLYAYGTIPSELHEAEHAGEFNVPLTCNDALYSRSRLLVGDLEKPTLDLAKDNIFMRSRLQFPADTDPSTVPINDYSILCSKEINARINLVDDKQTKATNNLDAKLTTTKGDLLGVISSTKTELQGDDAKLEGLFNTFKSSAETKFTNIDTRDTAQDSSIATLTANFTSVTKAVNEQLAGINTSITNITADYPAKIEALDAKLQPQITKNAADIIEVAKEASTAISNVKVDLINLINDECNEARKDSYKYTDDAFTNLEELEVRDIQTLRNEVYNMVQTLVIKTESMGATIYSGYDTAGKPYVNIAQDAAAPISGGTGMTLNPDGGVTIGQPGGTIYYTNNGKQQEEESESFGETILGIGGKILGGILTGVLGGILTNPLAAKGELLSQQNADDKVVRHCNVDLVHAAHDLIVEEKTTTRDLSIKSEIPSVVMDTGKGAVGTLWTNQQNTVLGAVEKTLIESGIKLNDGKGRETILSTRTVYQEGALKSEKLIWSTPEKDYDLAASREDYGMIEEEIVGDTLEPWGKCKRMYLERRKDTISSEESHVYEKLKVEFENGTVITLASVLIPR